MPQSGAILCILAYVDAFENAIAATSKGVSRGSLQTGASAVRRRLVLVKRDTYEDSRQVLAFLSSTAAAPALATSSCRRAA